LVLMGKWEGNKENRHVLTKEDSKKGGSRITERKLKALAINPLRHGRLAKSPHLPDEFLNCDGCKHRKACPFYLKDSSCKIQGAEPLKALAKLYGSDAIELLQTINKELVAYGLKARHSDKLADQHAWVRLLMEFYRLRYGSKELVLQLSRNLKDDEFESIVEIYKSEVLNDSKRGSEKGADGKS